jgi:hypothetical protein
MQERRRHPRKGMYCRVDFLDNQGHVAMGLARNISLGGMFVEYASSVTIGEIIVASFTLPTGQPFKAKAEVVRVDSAGFGLKFVDLHDRYPVDYLQELESFCAA